MYQNNNLIPRLLRPSYLFVSSMIIEFRLYGPGVIECVDRVKLLELWIMLWVEFWVERGNPGKCAGGILGKTRSREGAPRKHVFLGS